MTLPLRRKHQTTAPNRIPVHKGSNTRSHAFCARACSFLGAVFLTSTLFAAPPAQFQPAGQAKPVANSAAGTTTAAELKWRARRPANFDTVREKLGTPTVRRDEQVRQASGVSPFKDPFGDRLALQPPGEPLPAPRFGQPRFDEPEDEAPMLDPADPPVAPADPGDGFREPGAIRPAPAVPLDEPRRGMNPEVRASQLEVLRAMAAKECREGQRELLTSHLAEEDPRKQINIMAKSDVRRRDIYLELEDGDVSSDRLMGFDESTQEVLFRSASDKTFALDRFRVRYDDSARMLHIEPLGAGVGAAHPLSDIESITYNSGTESVSVRILGQGPPERHHLDEFKLLPHEMTEDALLGQWKNTWTKRGQARPFVKYGRPVFYYMGMIELQTIENKTVEVALNDLIQEDQDYFREKWSLEENRTWQDRFGNSLSGKLYDIQFGRVYVQDGSGTIGSLALRDLPEKDRWFVTQQWKLPAECMVPEAGGERCFVPSTFTWKASALCHKPLYFQDIALERYGHTTGPLVQPLASGAQFFLNIAVLPYRMGINPPTECRYALGYYRPGNCAPWLMAPIPLSPRGALFQAGAVTGAAFVIP